MPEGKDKPFVVTDRRRFTTEGEVRPDAPPHRDADEREIPASAATPITTGAVFPATQPSAPKPTSPPTSAGPTLAATQSGTQSGPRAVPREPAPEPEASDADPYAGLPAPTAEQTEQSRIAYEQTADRIDTAIRATNPGMDHPPAADFEQLVQSLYMTAIVQLGGVTAEGQKPQIDLLGARQSIDMLGVLGAKTAGNLNPEESKFLDSALFEVRMAFLEITQALARQASTRAQETGSPLGTGPTPGGAGPVGVKR